MSEEGRRFLEACGASEPLHLEWDDWESGQVVRRVFEKPSVLVGRNPDADLVLDHPRVGKRHAYLQMIDGRLYAMDLESRDGLRWSEVPRRSGWIDGGRPMQIGPTTIRVVSGDQADSDDPGAGPGPLSRRFVSRHPLPSVVLEVRGAEGEPKRWGMERVLTLVGSSPDCRVRLEPEMSRYVCGLVRTPKGVWMVDLLSSKGVAVNGVACRQARLEDGDLLQIGGQSIRLTYGELAAPPRRRESPPTSQISVPAPLEASWELVPEMVLSQLQGKLGQAPEGSAVPFDQALMMLVKLLGEIHRDHIEVVREEMEQIRRLNQEMGLLRATLPPPGHEPARSIPELEKETRTIHEHHPRERPAPHVVNAVVGERLAAWDKERQSRWRKVMDLLVKP